MKWAAVLVTLLTTAVAWQDDLVPLRTLPLGEYPYREEHCAPHNAALLSSVNNASVMSVLSCHV